MFECESYSIYKYGSNSPFPMGHEMVCSSIFSPFSFLQWWKTWTMSTGAVLRTTNIIVQSDTPVNLTLLYGWELGDNLGRTSGMMIAHMLQSKGTIMTSDFYPTNLQLPKQRYPIVALAPSKLLTIIERCSLLAFLSTP